jgi:hypothetical protein
MEKQFQINPFTNKKIIVGGQTYNLVEKILDGDGSFQDQQQLYLIEKDKNRKYQNIEDQYFCGNEGGYPTGLKKFPVNTERRCQAAINYAKVAPNPQGIRDCAKRIAREKGWTCTGNDFVLNPYTRKMITVGGKIHKIVQRIDAGPGSFKERQQKYLLETNPYVKSKYIDVEDQYFCGTEGGYPIGLKKFPVDTETRCRAALSYANNAPYPKGIRECAKRIARQKGWKCGPQFIKNDLH